MSIHSFFILLVMLFTANLALADSKDKLDKAFQDCLNSGKPISKCKKECEDKAKGNDEKKFCKSLKKEAKFNKKVDKKTEKKQSELEKLESKIGNVSHLNKAFEGCISAGKSEGHCKGECKDVAKSSDEKKYCSLLKRTAKMQSRLDKKEFNKICRGSIPDRNNLLADPELKKDCCQLLARETGAKIAVAGTAIAAATVFTLGAAFVGPAALSATAAASGITTAAASAAVAGGTSSTAIAFGAGAGAGGVIGFLVDGIKRMKELQCKENNKILDDLKKKASKKK